MHDHALKVRADRIDDVHIEQHKHPGFELMQDVPTRTRVALVGNPNVGKSLFFNYLSGMYVEVSNYPGTTIELTRGRFGDFEVYDTPGVYGISSFSDEERVTQEVVLEADVILNVVDAVHLERDLFLTEQLLGMGKKVTVFLNFMDEAEKLGLQINTALLEEYLGVPVFETTATTRAGFEQIEAGITKARRGTIDPKLHRQLHEALSSTGSEAEALLILEGEDAIAKRHGLAAGNDRERIYIERRNRVNFIVDAVLSDKVTRNRLSTLLGRCAINMWTGIPMLLAVLYLIYLFVGRLIAQDLVKFTEVELGKNLWEPWVRGLIGQYLPTNSWLGTLLIGEFGVLTMTITYLLFLLLPLVIAFYLCLALMEDSGYLPRLATLVDRGLNAIGLNGSAVIPLVLGFGCVTMATITTRLLGNDREKRIATAILQFAIPCSAQLAVVAALLTGAGFRATLIYSVTIFVVFVTLGTLLHRLLPGSTTPFLVDLPPIRLPRFDNVLRKTAFRAYYFMREATPWFFAGALAVGILQVTGLLILWQKALVPLTTGWLQLPEQAATAFVMGMVRRDFGAAGLYQLALTPYQTIVALVTITLFTPCIASLMVMLNERGTKEAVVVWVGTWIVAFLIGGLLSQALI